MYQNGDQCGYDNIKSYVRHRDNYKCQICKKFIGNIKNEVHHIKYRSQGGSDRPDNLILLCSKCHAKVHAGKVVCPSPKSNNQYRDGGVLNLCMKELFSRLESICPVQHTYGYITKYIRQYNNLEKTHAIDASLIALSDCYNMQDISEYSYTDHELSINFKQYRRHVRNFAHAYQDKKYYLGKKVIGYNKNKRSGQTKDSLVEAKRKYPNQDIVMKKSGNIVYRRNNKDIKFRPGDIINYNGDNHTCQGWASTQSKVILHNLGYVKQKLCKVVKNNQGMCWINYIQS
jgi:hypothetical protein